MVIFRLLRELSPLWEDWVALDWLMEVRYDNEHAIKQIEQGHHALISREPATDASKPGPSLKGKTLPRVVSLLPPTFQIRNESLIFDTRLLSAAITRSSFPSYGQSTVSTAP